MTISLVTTLSASNANSYVSVAEADAYWEARAFNSVWINDSIEDETKKAALVQAAKLLDTLQFIGRKLDGSQAMEWPRSNAEDRNGYMIDFTTIPRQVKDAQAELAGHLLKQDVTSAAASPGVRGFAAGSFRVEFDETPQSITVPGYVMRMLTGLTHGGMTARLLRA